MKHSINRHIGIFDSGLGGLTVLKELRTCLPNEKFIYFGDTAHVPYGNKSPEMINHYAAQIVKFLKEKDVKLIIIACNTVSSVALKKLQKMVSTPIIDVIFPSVAAVVRLSNIKTIGVIGTETTIHSLEYQKQIKNINKKINVISRPCSLLVPLIEEGLSNHPIANHIISMYLNEDFCKKIDALILGCTHYPMLKKNIIEQLGGHKHVIDSASVMAAHIKKYLKIHHLGNNKNNNLTNYYYVSDKTSRFNEIASMFLNEPIINIQHIQL